MCISIRLNKNTYADNEAYAYNEGAPNRGPLKISMTQVRCNGVVVRGSADDAVWLSLVED